MTRIRWRYVLTIALACLLGPALLALAAPSRFDGLISPTVISNTGTLTIGPSTDALKIEILDSTFGSPKIRSKNTPASYIFFDNNTFINANGGFVLPGVDLLLSFGSGTFKWQNVYSRHYGSGQSADPSCATGAALGSGGGLACSCNGTDSAMACTFTSGSSGTTTGTWGTITFNTAYSTAPTCVLSAGTGATAGSAVGYTVALNQASATTTTILVESSGTPATGATYYFNIKCEEAL